MVKNKSKKSKRPAASRKAATMKNAQKKRVLNRTRRRNPNPNMGIMRNMLNKGMMTSTPKIGTGEGLKWALAALHPCNESLTDAVAYPDSLSMPTHCTRMQRTITISPPNAKCSGGTQPSIDMCSWNLMIVTTPWPEYPWLACATMGNDEPPSLSSWLTIAGNKIHVGDQRDKPGIQNFNEWTYFAFPNFMDAARFGVLDDANDTRKKYNKLRVVAKGTTTYLNASRLYDGGRVICGQFPVSNRYIDTFDPTTVSLNAEELVDKVISRLCISGTAGNVDPKELRAALEHTHKVEGGAKLPNIHVPPQEVYTTNSATAVYQLPPNSRCLVRASGSAPLSGLPHSHLVTRAELQNDAAFSEFITHNHKVGNTTSSEPQYASGPAPTVKIKKFVTEVENTSVNLDFDKIKSRWDDPESASVGLYVDSPKSNGFTIKDITSEVDITSGVPIYSSAAGENDDELDSQNADADVCNPNLKLIKRQGQALEDFKLARDPDTKDNPNWLCGEPPHYETQLFYGDPKATTWEARKGTYQVMRIVNWDLDDVATGDATFFDITDPTKTQVFPEKHYDKTFAVNTQGTGTWAIAYYRNIATATSVTLKCVQYTQGEVNPTGPFANLQPRTVDPDPAAIELVAEENRRLAHAYPASYNDLGTILGKIFGIAKSVGKAVNAAAGHLGDVPIVGDIAKAVSGVLGGLGL